MDRVVRLSRRRSPGLSVRFRESQLGDGSRSGRRSEPLRGASKDSQGQGLEGGGEAADGREGGVSAGQRQREEGGAVQCHRG